MGAHTSIVSYCTRWFTASRTQLEQSAWPDIDQNSSPCSPLCAFLRLAHKCSARLAGDVCRRKARTARTCAVKSSDSTALCCRNARVARSCKSTANKNMLEGKKDQSDDDGWNAWFIGYERPNRWVCAYSELEKAWNRRIWNKSGRYCPNPSQATGGSRYAYLEAKDVGL